MRLVAISGLAADKPSDRVLLAGPAVGFTVLMGVVFYIIWAAGSRQPARR